MLPLLFLLLGLGLLYFGAQVLIKGGAALAFRFGLSALVVGLTVIAYGTSSPELVVSLQAAFSGNSAIAVGNVIGSNICNIALILGLCSLVQPLTASAQVIRREVPIMIGVSLLLVGVIWDGVIGRIDGALLLAGLITYTWLTVRAARSAKAALAEQEYDEDFHVGAPGAGRSVALVVLGLAVLIGGSHLFVTGAVEIARHWGISDVVIGLTVVAVGTSLPELATSLVAALRGHSDVAIGNVVGSNIFNVLGILGLVALVHPIDAAGLSRIDLGMMIATAVALLPVARSGGRVNRVEGAILLGVYVAYTVWLVAR
jgi:cation:H+ antiporter